jgi:hypothetical protein
MGKRKVAPPKKLTTEEAEENSWSLKDVTTDQQQQLVTEDVSKLSVMTLQSSDNTVKIQETPSEIRERRLIIVDEDDVEEAPFANGPVPFDNDFPELPPKKRKSPTKKRNNFFTSVIRTLEHNFDTCGNKRVCALGECTVQPDQLEDTSIEQTRSLQLLIERSSSENGDFYTYQFLQGSKTIATMKKSSIDPLWNSILRLLKKVNSSLQANNSIRTRFVLNLFLYQHQTDCPF